MADPKNVSITMPDLDSAEAVVSLWYVRPGDPVYEGDRVVEVLIPGLTFDVPSPASGRLRERILLPRDPVAPGQVIGTMETEGDG
jgi:pyruvate/2-oxoglutarate dehydrogenase complex dihydrolipoamide acyltransferase (E2) component